MDNLRQELKERGMVAVGRFYGPFQGFVSDNEDPLHLGRVKVKCPFVYGDDVMDLWAFPRGMNAGTNMGLYQLPLKGNPIWVSFVNGDPAQPLWEHGWWGTGDELAKVKERSTKVTIWQTTSGVRIYMDNETGYARIQSVGGKVIEVNNNGISLGSEDKSAEPAVKGDKNGDLLEKIINQLISNTQNLNAYAQAQTAACNSLPLFAVFAPGYAALITLVNQQQALLQQLIELIPGTKSKVVTLD